MDKDLDFKLVIVDDIRALRADLELLEKAAIWDYYDEFPEHLEYIDKHLQTLKSHIYD